MSPSELTPLLAKRGSRPPNDESPDYKKVHEAAIGDADPQEGADTTGGSQQ